MLLAWAGLVTFMVGLVVALFGRRSPRAAHDRRRARPRPVVGPRRETAPAADAARPRRRDPGPVDRVDRGRGSGHRARRAAVRVRAPATSAGLRSRARRGGTARCWAGCCSGRAEESAPPTGCSGTVSYDDPTSDLSRRRRSVQAAVRAWLAETGDGPLRVGQRLQRATAGPARGPRGAAGSRPLRRAAARARRAPGLPGRGPRPVGRPGRGGRGARGRRRHRELRRRRARGPGDALRGVRQPQRRGRAVDDRDDAAPVRPRRARGVDAGPLRRP